MFEADNESAAVPRDALATALVFGHLGEVVYREVAANHGLWCDAIAVARELWGAEEGAFNDNVSWQLTDKKMVPAVVERSVQFDPDRTLKIVDASTEDIAQLVGVLPQLRRLTLVDADLCEESMSRLAQLKELEHLQLYCPKNVTPQGLALLARGLPSLREFIVPTDNIDDKWMASVGEMNNLTHFEWNTGLETTDNGAKNLAKLKHLQTLIIRHGSELTEELQHTLVQLTALKDLEVSFCSGLGQAVLLKVSTLPLLESITLHGWSQLTCDGIESLQQVKGLRKFSASNMRIPPNEVFAAVGQLSQLESLSLHFISSYSLEDALVAHISELSLKVLHLDHCLPEPHDALLSLGKLTQLEDLVLGSISDNIANTLGCLSSLKSLYVDVNRYPEPSYLSDDGVAMVARCRSLEKLSICLDPVVEASGLILSSLNNVTDLTLRHSGIQDEGLDAICQMMQLERLDIGDCPSITAEGMRHVPKLIHLEELVICECTIDDEGFRGLQNLTKLKSLFANGIKGITTDAFDGIEKMRSLSLLDLSNYSIEPTLFIDDEAIARIAELPLLRELSLGEVRESSMVLIKQLGANGVSVSYNL